jgi:hypothetical protein
VNQLNSINFLEHLYDKIKSKEIQQNHPMPIALHQGLAYTVSLDDRTTHLLYLPYENTGIAYVERISGSIDIVPLYKGYIIEEFEISHGMDLHKPKTEEATLKLLYNKSWELHQALSQSKYEGSAADYLYKFHHLCLFLNYFNSSISIPTEQKKAI